MIKPLSIVCVLWLALLLSLTTLFGTTQQIQNTMLGGVIASLNLIVLVWAMGNIFNKKSVALAGSVIVIKYIALIGVFVALHLIGWKMDFSFALGLSTMFPGIGYLVFKYAKNYSE